MDLLDNVSQDSIIIICIAMCIIALLLAIVVVYQLIESKRKKEKEEEFYEGNYGYGDSNNEVTLNIKPDENIVYADESDETERAKAKEELRKLKEKLLNDEIARQEEEKKSREINIEKKKVNIEVNKTNNTEITKELVNLPLEVKALENEKQKEEETIREEIVPEVKVVEPVIATYAPEINEVINDEKEEPVALKVEDTTNKVRDIKEIDAATKERIIDEYLKQAIVKRIEEEKEKQEILKKKIEQERNILSFNDSDLEIIDSYLENEENLKEEHNPIEDIEVIEDNFVEDEKPIEESIIVEDNVESAIKDGILEEANVGTTVVNTSDDEEVIEEKEQEEDKPSLYEQLEEENAIISYDELLKASKFGYTDEEMDNYVDEKDAIISLDEFEKLYKEVNKIAKNDNTLDLSNIELNKKEEEPVKIEEPIKTDEVTITKLSDEIKKTNDFLQTLKDLQKNLE